MLKLKIIQLINLIKSLSPSENRRYLSYRRDLGGITAIERLYDTIYNQCINSEPNEEAIVSGLISNDNRALRTNVKKLNNDILFFLKENTNCFEKTLKIHQNIQNIIILFSRELFEDCLRLIDETKKDIHEVGHPSLMNELLFYELKIKLSKKTEDFQNDFLRINGERAKYIEYIKKQDELLVTTTENLTNQWTGEKIYGTIKAYEIIKLDAIQWKRGLKENNKYNAIYFDFLNLFYSSASTHLQIYGSGNDIEIFEMKKEQMELFWKYKEAQKEDPDRYYKELGNYFSICYKLEKYNEIENSYKFILEYGEIIDSRYCLNILPCHLIYYYSLKKHEEGIKYIVEKQLIEKIFEKNINIPSHRFFSVLLFIISIYFQNRNWEESIQWIEKLLSYKKYNVKPEVKIIATLLKFFSFYEIKKNDEFDNIIENLRLIIHNLSEGKVIYSNTLQLLRRLNNSQTLPEERILKEYQSLLNSYLKETSHNDPFHIIKDWIDYRLSK